jgi:hypothetical protein
MKNTKINALEYIHNLTDNYEYFIEQEQQMKKRLTPKQLNNMCKYKGTLSYNVNNRMRGIEIIDVDEDHWLYNKFNKTNNATDRKTLLSKYVKSIDRYIDQFNALFQYSPRFQKDTVLYRIVNNDSGFLPSKGKSTILRGLTSCSIDISHIIYYIGGLSTMHEPWSDLVLLQMTVSKGTPYIFIDAHCWTERDMMSKQGEIILPDKMRITITDELPPLCKIKVLNARIDMITNE